MRIQHLQRLGCRTLATEQSQISFKGKSIQTLREIGARWKEKTTNGVMLPTQFNEKDRKKRAADRMKDSMYILSMFPYPSGTLHMGHLRVYVISDSLNRFFKQRGYEVIHPMGWDAFGLPAENAAIARGINPADWTKQNIAKMKEQMNNMLANFDWDREVTTCDPDYYKFNQWIFLKLYENGLAYQKEAEINWDPVDKTVLANEQVDSNGISWRSGAKVEKRQLKQWFLGITKFAKDLRKDLYTLKKWPENVKTMQRNWIGESSGATLLFGTDNELFKHIQLFTTRAETLFAVQFVALSKEHPIVEHYAKTDPKLREFITIMDTLPDDSKTGYLLKDIKAINPLTKKKVSIFVAPYVIGSYGSDNEPGAAVMGCPAHDERDFAFWHENSPNEPIISCIDPFTLLEDDSITALNSPLPYTYDLGSMSEICAEYHGLATEAARASIVQKLRSENLGHTTINYKIRDWLISRQRYWGTPIPIIHCDHCGPVPVPEKDLPVMLPEVKTITAKGGNPLSQIPEFVNAKCPSCGSDAKRETDTMDTFMDSSWYFFRYLDPKNKELPFDPKLASRNIPVDIYIGGVEHAILHLLYARFISKFLGSIGMFDGAKFKFEPFKQLVTQGMVQGKTYINPENGRFLKPDEVELDTAKGHPIIKATGLAPQVSYEKMSKSKYNGADPNQCIAKHGPDATRAHILFQSPITDALAWDEVKIIGIERWLIRVIRHTMVLSKEQKYAFDYTTPSDMTDPEIEFHNEIQRLLKSITQGFDIYLSLNTVISDYMKFTNVLENAYKNKTVRKELQMLNLQKLISVIYPVTPSISEEAADILMKEQNGWENWNHYQWPSVEHITQTNFKKFQIVVDGRAKFYYTTEKDFFKKGRDHVIETLKHTPDGRKYLSDKTIKKFVMKFNIISFQFYKAKDLVKLEEAKQRKLERQQMGKNV